MAEIKIFPPSNAGKKSFHSYLRSATIIPKTAEITILMITEIMFEHFTFTHLRNDAVSDSISVLLDALRT